MQNRRHQRRKCHRQQDHRHAESSERLAGRRAGCRIEQFNEQAVQQIHNARERSTHCGTLTRTDRDRAGVIRPAAVHIASDESLIIYPCTSRAQTREHNRQQLEYDLKRTCGIVILSDELREIADPAAQHDQAEQDCTARARDDIRKDLLSLDPHFTEKQSADFCHHDHSFFP